MQHVWSFSLLLIATFLVVYSLYALRYRSSSQMAAPFACLMVALAVYASGYAGELISPTLEHMLFWSTFQYIGISFIPFLWLNLVAQYVNTPFFRNRSVQIAFLTFSSITLFSALTDPWLHLKYASVYIGTEPGFPVLGFTRGPLYFFHIIYTLCSFITGIVLLGHSLLSTQKAFRKKLILMIAGSSLPCIDYVLYLINIRMPGIDTIPFSMFFSVLFFGLALISESILEVAPVARSLVFEMLSDPVIVVDSQNRIADYNKAADMLFPGIADNINPVSKLLKMKETTDDSEFQTDIPCNKEIRKFNCHVSRIPAAPDQHKPQGSIFLFKDVTESAQILEKMKKLATIDSLTRLYNRRYFMERAIRVISVLEHTGGTLSFIIADLDLFKQINDTRGHLAGDAVIQAAAAAFTANIRSPNITARFGGEEFICLLPNTNIDSAFIIAEQIRKQIAQIPFPPNNQNPTMPDSSTLSFSDKHPYITASFGVATTNSFSGEQTITDLVSRADKALYKSKNAGRNQTTIG